MFSNYRLLKDMAFRESGRYFVQLSKVTKQAFSLSVSLFETVTSMAAPAMECTSSLGRRGWCWYFSSLKRKSRGTDTESRYSTWLVHTSFRVDTNSIEFLSCLKLVPFLAGVTAKRRAGMSRRLRVLWGRISAYRLLPIKTSRETHHHTTKNSDDPAKRKRMTMFLGAPSSVRTEKFKDNRFYAHNMRCKLVVSYCSSLHKRTQKIIGSDLPLRGPGLLYVTSCLRFKILHFYTMNFLWYHESQKMQRLFPCIVFWNVVLEKDGEDQLDRSCEKWRSVTSCQWAEEYPMWNTKTEG